MSRQLNFGPCKYEQQVSNLNAFAIRIKREILEGVITTITCEEVDAATIPAIDAMWSEKKDIRKR